MISTAMAAAIGAQIDRELYSANFYLSLSAHADSMDLKGTAAWFLAKHQEELNHALKMFRYLMDQDATLSIGAVAAPASVEDGVLPIFEHTLEHERAVTGHINDLVDLALRERDHATGIFLHWFVTEQIEEEATVKDIIGRLRRFGDSGHSLLAIDTELSALAAKTGKSSAPAADAAA